ncbi:23 kDa integral membrane protein-like [Manduca sexta]|uniref:23 kDa integral membrane protein-like n=1 Tax=Manduca sexta TaxID=7130 RepID=UPI00188E810E|nr:23 kDa integral membrane protein-like [Manduca sexta]
MTHTGYMALLAGLGLLGIGIAVQLQISAITNLITDSSFQVAPISSMVVGGIVFVVAFFGCCGAIRESNCMLVTYSIFMLVLMVLKLTLAVLIFVKLDDVVQEIPRWLNEVFNRDPIGFHEIERTFQCCGPAGPVSYLNLKLPDTCCASPPCNIVSSDNFSGCNGILQDFFNTFGLVIGVVAIVVVAIELVAVVFGLCLANHVRNKSRRARY